jgi:hypothetical protein
MDRAQQAPPRPHRRYPPLISVDPPDREPEPDPDDAEDVLDTPSSIPTPEDRRRPDILIPIGEILPGDGPLLPPRSRRTSSSSPTQSRIFSDAINGDASSQTSTDDARTIVPEREAGPEITEEGTPKARDPNPDGYDYLQHIGAVGAQGRPASVATVSMEQITFQRVRSGTIEDSDWTTPYSRTWHDDQGKQTAGYNPVPHIQVLTNTIGSAASTASDSSESPAHTIDLSLSRSLSLSTTSSQYERCQRMQEMENYNTIGGLIPVLTSEEIHTQCNEARVEKLANLKQNIEVQGRIAEGESSRA